MDRAKGFWDKFAAIYAKQPIADEAAYQTKLKVTQNYFRPDMDVFEFGCGTGSTAIAHAPFVRRIDAIDYSEKMIDIARKKAQTGDVTNVAFNAANILAVDAPGKYDAVLGLNILHLLEERNLVIDTVFNMLRPGGIFVTSTICLGDANQVINGVLAAIIRVLWFLPRLSVMTTDELVSSFTNAGFEIVHNWLPGKGKAVFIIAKKRV